MGKEAFAGSLDPWDRARKLLVEIQKRNLAEQVLLVSWDSRRDDCNTIAMAPADESSRVGDDACLDLMREAYRRDRALSSEDLSENKMLCDALTERGIQSLIVYPVTRQRTLIDVLMIVNFSASRNFSQVIEYVDYIASVLAVALQNLRLYLELQKKDLELREWSGHVEKRIDEGTKQLIEREHQYQSLFEGTMDGILVHDGSGRIVEVNRAACRLLGYEKRELLGQTWNRLGISKVLPEQMAFFGRIQRRERVRPLETLLRCKDGTTVQVELSSQRVRFREKDAIQTLIHDVSIRKDLENSLRESKDKYRLFLESSLVGVFIIWDGVVHFANSMFQEITGYGQEDLLAMSFYDLIAPEDRELVREREMHREMGETAPDHYEIRFLKRGGVTTWVEIRACRVVLDGKPAVLGNVIDLTHSRQLQESLLESQKMESIRTLAGGIAHDFNNLLGGILGYASLLLSEMSDTHPFRDDVSAIAETTNRAADLSNRLLAFARGGKYRVTTLDLGRIVEGEAEDLSRAFDGIDLEFSSDAGLWPVHGDTQQIRQSLRNVLQNAMEAMPEGGDLRVVLSNVSLDDRLAANLSVTAGDYVRLEIEDTGIGMDEETRRRVFEPFFSSKTGGEGTGLGLSMVYGIILNHDGAIHVESREGEGTRVLVYLPRHIEAEEVEAAAPAPEPVATKTVDAEPVEEPRTILVVDDEAVIRHVVRRMLEQGGFEVLTAENGKQALAIFGKNRGRIDMVLLDLIMPVMGGRETYRRLRDLDPDVKIALTSGYSPLDSAEYRTMDAPFIPKPFRTESLLGHIRAHIGIPTAIQS